MRTDVLLDENYDLPDTGAWEEGNSDQQHIELLLFIQKGELKQFPAVGFGVETRINEIENKHKFERELKIELENDGYHDPELVFNGIGDFEIFI